MAKDTEAGYSVIDPALVEATKKQTPLYDLLPKEEDHKQTAKRTIRKLQQKIKTHILEIIGEILFTVAALILIYIIIY